MIDKKRLKNIFLVSSALCASCLSLGALAVGIENQTAEVSASYDTDLGFNNTYYFRYPNAIPFNRLSFVAYRRVSDLMTLNLNDDSNIIHFPYSYTIVDGTFAYVTLAHADLTGISLSQSDYLRFYSSIRVDDGAFAFYGPWQLTFDWEDDEGLVTANEDVVWIEPPTDSVEIYFYPYLSFSRFDDILYGLKNDIDDFGGEEYSLGYSDGVRDGYAEGESSMSDTAQAFVNLFGVVARVPFEIFNGLGDLAIWNVPILNLLVTFLLISLFAFVIRKFI